MKTESGQRNEFVCSKLPWLVGAAALVVYLVTLNTWVSLNNLGQVSRASGWAWGTETYGPLFYLVTYPFHWLPESWVPLAFNLFSAICAALTLALLARSVALLPHDRTKDQRMRNLGSFSLLSSRLAWIPPVVAAALFGLQLTFWEDATGGSSDVFDMLLIAGVIWCLLEYRISEQEYWMWVAALVCGAAMANGWVMFCLFPAFVAAVIWIRGLSFFNLGFLSRMVFFGAAGLLLYLLLPLVNAFSPDGLTFWGALKANLAAEKGVFVYFAKQVPANVLLLLAVTSLVPVVLIGIRWKSNTGEVSRTGNTVSTWTFHFAHAVLLGACVWVAFDPAFSPHYKGYSIPALYYLGALSVGYFCGYFLVVFAEIPNRARRLMHRQPPIFNQVAHGLVWALLILVPLGLIYKNLPRIHFTNGPALRQYASDLGENLPDHAVVLSDDPQKTLLAEAWAASAGKAGNYIFLDSDMLESPDYYRAQEKKHADEWLPLVEQDRTNKVASITLLRLMAKLQTKMPLYYLHPSFGYYFEYFHARPHGLVFELTPYPTNVLSEPITEGDIAQNEKFWQAHRDEFDNLEPLIQAPVVQTGFRHWFNNNLHIPFEPNPIAATLGAYYSQGMDYWAVQMQRAGKVDAAGDYFAGALKLNPKNVIAGYNLAFNEKLKSGKEIQSVASLKPREEDFGVYRTWLDAVRQNGPLDDPFHSFGEALVLGRNGLLRQSAQRLERVHELVPDDPTVDLWLARLYTTTRFPEKALDVLAGIHGDPDTLADAGVHHLELVQTKAAALFAAKKQDEAGKLLHETIEKSPKDPRTLALVFQLSTMFHQYSNALDAVDRQLALAPDSTTNLLNKGFVNIQMERYQDAIAPLSKVIEVESTNYVARMDRAIAYLNCGKLDEAKQDYEEVQKAFPKMFQVYYGLGEIAYRNKDTNAAIQYYELYLTNGIAGSQEAKFVGDRLNKLKSGML